MQGQAHARAALGGVLDREGAPVQLRLLGHLVFGYFWAQMVKVSLANINGDDAKFYKSKIATARFYFGRLFTETASLKLNLKSGSKAVMEIEEDAFVF